MVETGGNCCVLYLGRYLNYRCYVTTSWKDIIISLMPKMKGEVADVITYTMEYIEQRCCSHDVKISHLIKVRIHGFESESRGAAQACRNLPRCVCAFSLLHTTHSTPHLLQHSNTPTPPPPVSPTLTNPSRRPHLDTYPLNPIAHYLDRMRTP